MHPDDWRAHLLESKKQYKNASHIAYVTLKILKENRLLIKIILDLHKSATSLIKAFLDYEAKENGLRLSKKPLENFEIFINKIYPIYAKPEDLENFIKIFKIAKKHKDAPLEFVRKDKFVIFQEKDYEILNLQQIKNIIFSLGRVINSFPDNNKL